MVRTRTSLNNIESPKGLKTLVLVTKAYGPGGRGGGCRRPPQKKNWVALKCICVAPTPAKADILFLTVDDLEL